MKKRILTITVILAAAFANAAFDFDKSDVNKDGSLSKEEWMAGQKVGNPKANEKAHAAWFKSNDKNKDGKVTKQEFAKRKAEQKKKREAAKKKK
jgi:Ca2+-binding EF-hand superfamily protein